MWPRQTPCPLFAPSPPPLSSPCRWPASPRQLRRRLKASLVVRPCLMGSSAAVSINGVGVRALPLSRPEFRPALCFACPARSSPRIWLTYAADRSVPSYPLIRRPLPVDQRLHLHRRPGVRRPLLGMRVSLSSACSFAQSAIRCKLSFPDTIRCSQSDIPPAPLQLPRSQW